MSGVKWQSFVRDRIFLPAGMKTSTITDGPHPSAGVAHAYERVGETWVEADYGEVPTFAAAGNGGVWSSVEELALYERALARSSRRCAAPSRRGRPRIRPSRPRRPGATLRIVIAAASQFPIHLPSADEEQRIVLEDVPWAVYVMLRDSIESASVRMTYLQGVLEIMSPSRTHEVDKKQIARFLELFCLERDIPLFGYGSTTFRKEEKQRGLEPDECYSRDVDKEVPDIALEVVVTRGAIDKLDVYRGLGVREVWVFEDGAFRLFTLRADHYEPIDRSDVLPEVDLTQLAGFARRADQHEALKAYRDALRAG